MTSRFEPAKPETPQEAPKCSCGRVAELTDGREIYPHRPDLAAVPIWICRPCGARSGCHKGTTKPTGTLADYATRKARMFAHDAFDRLWRGQGPGRRKTAYQWLQQRLDLTADECHIGLFDIAACNRVVEVCEGMEPFR